MTANKKDLPAGIYHRIYRLAAKKVSVNKIALVLNLPFNTVKNVVDHFSFTSKNNPDNQKSTTESEVKETDANNSEQQPYLDIYVLQRLRFTILDLNGMVTEDCLPTLQLEVTKLLASDIKAVAILMCNVIKISDAGYNVISIFCNEFMTRGRYCALLDPSEEVESYILKNGLQDKYPIFGTEKAFEDNAFKTRKK